MKEQDFVVSGMSCTACAARVEKAARSVPGVREAQVNLVTGILHVVREEETDAQKIIQAVQNYGYGAQEKRQATPEKKRSAKQGWCVVASVGLLIPLVILHYMRCGEWVQALLATGIAMLNYRFFTRGVRTLAQGDPGMDALVALGSGVALVDGLVHLGMGESGGMFMESAGMILTFVSVGKWLEARATRRTGQAVEKLNHLLPTTAAVLRDGAELHVPTEQLQPGDCLVVHPGDRIAADGSVLAGISAADESALTGESMPVDKQEGSDVYAGTVNLHGLLRVRVARSQDQSALSGVIRLVSNAASREQRRLSESSCGSHGRQGGARVRAGSSRGCMRHGGDLVGEWRGVGCGCRTGGGGPGGIVSLCVGSGYAGGNHGGRRERS